MKNRIIILSVLVCLGIGVIFIWKIFLQNTNRNAVDVISSEALFVFETTEPVLAWNQLVSQPFWKSISGIPALKNAEYNLLVLDSLAGKSGVLQKNLKGNQLAVSLHLTGKEEFDFLFVLAYQNPEGFSLMEDLEKKILANGTISSRNYSGINIRELKTKTEGITLAYAQIDNLLAVSFTSFLIEDAIRHSQNDALSVFGGFYSELFKDIPKSKDLGILRVGSSGIAGIINGIAKNNNLPSIRNFAKNKMSANLHLKFSADSIFFDGALFFEGKGNVGIKHLGSPAFVYFRDLVPNRTATYFQYQLEDPFQLFSGMDSDFSSNSLVMGDIETGLVQKGFTKYLTGHMAFLNLEKLPKEPQDKILLLKTENPNVQFELLKKFGLGENQEIDVSRLMDFYQGKEIFMLSSDEFPAHLFNGNFMGFGDSYFTLVDDVIIIANSSKAIKLFIDDWKRGRTWGQFKQQNSILPFASQSGFNMVLDTQNFWNNLMETSAPGWKSFFQRYESEFKTFDKMVLNARQSGNKTQLHIGISHHQGLNTTPKEGVSLTENVSIPFPNRLVYGPVSIQNFIDNSVEFVIQDELNRLYLLTNDGEEIFSTELDGPIVSDVFQFDFYKNGKLQLIFATKEMIYGMDRTGNALPEYPVELANESITELNLLDYEGDRNYRIFAGTQKGNLYLLDKYGLVLEGWDPKSIGSTFAIKPAHHRVAGIGDRMVALGTNGNIHFFNRRGQPEPGSPVQIKGELGSEYVLLERGTAKETQLITVTKGGEVVMVNLLGEVTFRNQLLRPDRESRFYLVKDQKEGRYLFVIHEYNKVTVLDSDFKEVFSKPIMSEGLKFQYFSFGSTKNIFVVVDQTQDFVFLYDMDGELLNPIPISGSNKVEIEYTESKNECTIYAIGPKGFSAYKLSL
ncbi:hypothetical protein M3O96_01965 [Aquiflexum sp. TKW24L]|uniref:hypothetical protein n=1 Tax=Aquiflexum sp. TKW24L TaxID=2942212 RepID=UPI0020C09121|nr:hypothetical protein [Aquiflexum sp. TKW24L]MCL6257836.1 hypothetical protein [Aquiflexum sp. TKW24L]